MTPHFFQNKTQSFTVWGHTPTAPLSSSCRVSPTTTCFQSPETHACLCALWGFAFSKKYLATLGVSCAMQDLHCSMRTLSCHVWALVPWPGIEPELPALGLGVLATGPPGKYLHRFSTQSFLLCHKTVPHVFIFLNSSQKLPFWLVLLTKWASLVAQLVKNLPVTQETLVWFLGQEDPLGKG